LNKTAASDALYSKLHFASCLFKYNRIIYQLCEHKQKLYTAFERAGMTVILVTDEEQLRLKILNTN